MSQIKAADVIAMFNRLRELPPAPINLTEEEIVKMEQFADWLEGGQKPEWVSQGDVEVHMHDNFSQDEVNVRIRIGPPLGWFGGPGSPFVVLKPRDEADTPLIVEE